jgi:hypothetical protein
MWTDCCHWRALQGDEQLAWSGDSRERIAHAAATLNGQKLLGIVVDPNEGRSTFTFDLGGSLETWPYGDDPSHNQWTILSRAEGFSYRADGCYWHGSNTTPVEDDSWLPLR